MPTAQFISAGVVSVNMTVNPIDIQIISDGSFNILLQLNLNGALRTRTLTISSDASTYYLDGAVIASPPASLTALGTAIVSLTAKMTTFFNLTAIQTALAAP